MADYIEISVAAINVSPVESLESGDEGVPGVYSVMVPKGLSEGTMASAALDAFHMTVPVSYLDDFQFVVFDPRTLAVLHESDGTVGYAHGGLGCGVVKVQSTVPTLNEDGSLTF